MSEMTEVKIRKELHSCMHCGKAHIFCSIIRFESEPSRMPETWICVRCKRSNTEGSDG